MPTSAALMTVEELRRLPLPEDGTAYELHRGELVSVTIPKYQHQKCSERIAAELRVQLGHRGSVLVECPFRALPEHEARRADVAFVSAERDVQAEAEGELFGAPDLVVEVLSPSNMASEMDDKEALCFASGCREFWLVNPARRTVKVTRAAGTVRWFGAGEEIPLDGFGGGPVAVDCIFPTRKAE